jgi:hypothetical protein
MNPKFKLPDMAISPLKLGFWASFGLGHSGLEFSMCAILAFGWRAFSG